jgi:hypothetical protein
LEAFIVVLVFFLILLALVAIGLAIIPAHAGSNGESRRLAHDSQRFEDDLQTHRDCHH